MGNNVNGRTGCECICNKNHTFKLYFTDWLYNERGCPQCAIIKYSGEGHWNWQNGGHQETIDALRHAIAPWKKECLAQAEYKCDISKIKTPNLIVHHLNINFSDLVKLASLNTGIPILNSISGYSIEQRQALEQELLSLHKKYCKGIVIDRKYHDEFHDKYGKTNNTEEQYNKFKKEKIEELNKE